MFRPHHYHSLKGETYFDLSGRELIELYPEAIISVMDGNKTEFYVTTCHGEAILHDTWEEAREAFRLQEGESYYLSASAWVAR